MISWILIALACALVLVVFIKFKELRHKYVYTFLIIVLIVFGVTLVYVYFKSDAKISSYDGLISLGKSYFSWLGSAFHNAGKISGYVLQQGWGINSTSTK
jgi:glucan phosphoethanolaminetransferase (alkaline phosphatase superfamily)